MVLSVGDLTHVGGPSARLAVAAEPHAPTTAFGRRLLLLDDRPAFELSLWCGTCPYLFERLEGANDTVALPALADRLSQGLDAIDHDVVRTYGSLLAEGEVLPLLLEVQPRLQRPVEAGDYFSEEQVATWGINAFWGLPENPHTPYYRTYETPVDQEAHLYEAIVPMVPPTMNQRAIVDAYAERPAATSRPTAVAFSTLDICAPAVDSDGTDWYHHWGLTHFLLDGHHKVQAAAESDRPLRLLALVSIDGSLAARDDVLSLPRLRRQPAAPR